MTVKRRGNHKYPICRICGCNVNESQETHAEHLLRHGKKINPNSGSSCSYWFTRPENMELVLANLAGF